MATDGYRSRVPSPFCPPWIEGSEPPRGGHEEPWHNDLWSNRLDFRLTASLRARFVSHEEAIGAGGAVRPAVEATAPPAIQAAGTGEAAGVASAAEAAAPIHAMGTLEVRLAISAEQEAAASRLAEREAAIQASLRISKIAPDYATKGVHIHVDGIELKVLPGEGGTIVFKPVFSSQEAVAGAAIKLAGEALADPAFRMHLHDTATRATEYLRRSGLPGAAANSGETHFLRIALEKMGLD